MSVKHQISLYPTKKYVGAQLYTAKRNKLKNITIYPAGMMRQMGLDLKKFGDILILADELHYVFLAEFVCYEIRRHYGIKPTNKKICTPCFPKFFVNDARDYAQGVITENKKWVCKHPQFILKSTSYEKLSRTYYKMMAEA